MPVSLLRTFTRSPIWPCPLKGSVIVMAAVVALVSGCASSTRSSPSTSFTSEIGKLIGAPPPADVQTTAAPPPVGLNQEVNDGTFGFTVFYVSTTKKLETTAHANIVNVFMYVTNVGATQQRYFADYQRLRDNDGRLFSPDIQAIGPEFDQVDLNPGIRTAVELYFDVPEGTASSQYVLVLHGSPDSVGAAVRLQEGGNPEG